MKPNVQLNQKSHTFTITASNVRSKRADSRWITQEVKHKKELAGYEKVVAIWRRWASAPFPSSARRLGPVKTEISQMKLMRTSGGGSTYSSSRLSSLWLLVHSDTLSCLCKTVLFLQPPKGAQQWLNTPKWPYQLFYYFSNGGRGGRQGGRNTFSARRFS